MTQAGRFDREATIERLAVSGDPEYVAPDETYGTTVAAWVPLDGYQTGSPRIGVRCRGQRQDMLPSRSETVQQGLPLARNQVRWRMRWRDDIDSSMRITIHGDSDVIYQIVAGPAEFGGRKEQIELVLERYSS